MNPEILKAHALYAQHKLSKADYEALILGMVAGNRREPVMKYCPKCNRVHLHTWDGRGWKCEER
jgi:hypothetical protein